MPSEFLIAISIGPVQGFIAAARRTRDFWMGSVILSEVAKKIARALLEHQPKSTTDQPDLERLIFPGVTNIHELDPITPQVVRKGPAEEFSASNVILCRVETHLSVATIADHARTAAYNRISEFMSEAKIVANDDIDHAQWGLQAKPEDILEFYAAWTQLVAGDYKCCRDRVMSLLAGRKALRDFSASKFLGAKVPKSSLDGARETVLKPSKDGKRRTGLRIKGNEQLDVIGVTKRAEYGPDMIRFPSVSRFAVDSWVRAMLANSAPDNPIELAWQPVVDACKELVPQALSKRGNLDHELFPWLKSFPFEGTPLYVSRHLELQDESFGDPRNVEIQLDRLRKSLDRLKKAALEFGLYGEPSPYFAIVMADGDQMGKVISALKDPKAHREFSTNQSEFARQARDIARRKFHGACAYAGADDVLAFMPVDHAIPFARELRDAFKRTVADKLSELSTDPPTLSVGVAIGHFMEPLEDLLSYARNAEKRAKKRFIRHFRGTLL